MWGTFVSSEKKHTALAAVMAAAQTRRRGNHNEGDADRPSLVPANQHSSWMCGRTVGPHALGTYHTWTYT